MKITDIMNTTIKNSLFVHLLVCHAAKLSTFLIIFGKKYNFKDDF